MRVLLCPQPMSLKLWLRELFGTIDENAALRLAKMGD